MPVTFENEIEQALADAIAASRDDLIHCCQRLLQTPSVNGEHDEIALAEVIAAEAERLGLHAQVVGQHANRPNVIVSTSGKGETGLLLLGHLDTVPPGDAASWTHPPFSGAIADGCIYGRGAIDTKGGMAAALYALVALAHAGLPLRTQFIGVPDEETGATGTLGVTYLAERGLLNAKGAIYAYSGSQVILGHRGLLRYRLVCTGAAIHTGSYEWQEETKGANAVTGMARLLLALESHAFPYSSTPYFEPYRTVVTPGTVISGGVSVNVVPDRCEALVDIRTTPDNDVAVIEALLTRTIREIEGEKVGISFSYERLNFIPAVISDEHAPLFSVLGEVIPLVKGFPAERTVAGPANEGYLLIGRGIPTVCGLGPTGANAHAANEYVEIEGLVDAALIFALTGYRMALLR